MIRVEHGTRFFDESDERCFLIKLVLERGRYNAVTQTKDDDLIIGFVQFYDTATGESKRYCGRFNERNPSASINHIMQHGVKFDNTINDWSIIIEHSKNHES